MDGLKIILFVALVFYCSKVWYGIKKMCKAITLSPCDCPKTQASSTNISEPYIHTTTMVTETSAPAPPEFPLQIVSINSSGSDTDPTKVSVNYTATPTHTTEWIAMRQNGATWRTGGRKSETMADRRMFTSTVDIEQFQSMKNIFFYLYNDEEIISVSFNLTELRNAQQQTIIEPTIRLFDVNSSYMAPADGDLNITTFLNKTVADMNDIVSVDVFFSGVNTTSSEIFETFSFNSDDIRIDHSSSAPKVVVTIGHPSVQFGGLLTLRYEQNMKGVLKVLCYGPVIKIFAPGTKDIVRNNTLGVFPLKQETFIYPPSTSLVCIASGKPRPNVSVLKIASDGETKEMPTETVISDKYTTMKILSLSPKQPVNTEGHYICRASNGNQSVDAKTEVIIYESPVFDDTVTGVVQNDSEIIVISCKATGNPKPDLLFRLYGDYGPDLKNAGIYKVWRTDALTSRVTLKITAADGPDIHTVFCTASQKDSTEVSKKIEIYPGMHKDYNWELYERLWGS